MDKQTFKALFRNARIAKNNAVITAPGNVYRGQIFCSIYGFTCKGHSSAFDRNTVIAELTIAGLFRNYRKDMAKVYIERAREYRLKSTMALPA